MNLLNYCALQSCKRVTVVDNCAAAQEPQVGFVGMVQERLPWTKDTLQELQVSS